MKFFNTFLISAAILLAIPGLALSNNSTNNVVESQQDGEILAFVNATNTQEINEADVALQKNVSASVKDFANMMIQDHNQSLADTKSLSKSINIQPVETAEVKKAMTEGQNELKKISALNGHQFEVAYVDDMVNGHTKALTMIDKFIKTVHNTSLKDYLIKLRSTVDMHLQHAKKLQSEIKK